MKYFSDLDSLELNESIYIYGAGSLGRTFYDQLIIHRKDIKVSGFIDKNVKNDTIRGKKVISFKNFIYNDSKVIICTSKEYWKEIYNQFTQTTQTEVYINIFFDFNIYFRESKFNKLNNFNSNKLLNIFDEDRKPKVKKYLNSIKKKTVKDFLDIKAIDSFEKYYEKVSISKGDIIINGGSAYGDDDSKLIQKVGSDGVVYSFDPNIEKPTLSKNSKTYPFILSNYTGKLNFYYNGSRSRIMPSDMNFTNANKESCKIVQSIKIDEFVIKNNISKIDLITLDVEGSELEVLKGAKKTLLKYKPKLAISIYHSVADFFEIPLYLSKIINDYKFSLGIYNSQGINTQLHCAVEIN